MFFFLWQRCIVVDVLVLVVVVYVMVLVVVVYVLVLVLVVVVNVLVLVLVVVVDVLVLVLVTIADVLVLVLVSVVVVDVLVVLVVVSQLLQVLSHWLGTMLHSEFLDIAWHCSNDNVLRLFAHRSTVLVVVLVVDVMAMLVV